jgi:hypothetical protein
MGTMAAASLGMTGDSNGAIAAVRQRTQLRQRVRHSDTEGAIAYTDAREHAAAVSPEEPIGQPISAAVGMTP